MGVDEHGVFSAGWFLLAGTRRPGGNVAGEGACCPTSHCAACRCRCCWCCCIIMGTGGVSSDPGGLAKDGQLEKVSRQAACQPQASIWVSISPLPFACPKNVHAHIYTCTYTYINVYTSHNIHTCLNAYVHAYIRFYIHTYRNTYIYTSIHTYLNKSILK